MQGDAHYLTLLRYVERNALRARLAVRAERWRWCSLWLRTHGVPEGAPPLSDGPLSLPHDWPALVNAPLTAAEEEAMQLSLTRAARSAGPRGSDEPPPGWAWRRRSAPAAARQSSRRRRNRFLTPFLWHLFFGQAGKEEARKSFSKRTLTSWKCHSCQERS